MWGEWQKGKRWQGEGGRAERSGILVDNLFLKLRHNRLGNIRRLATDDLESRRPNVKNPVVDRALMHEKTPLHCNGNSRFQYGRETPSTAALVTISELFDKNSVQELSVGWMEIALMTTWYLTTIIFGSEVVRINLMGRLGELRFGGSVRG